jgi:WD40 repeat protein
LSDDRTVSVEGSGKTATYAAFISYSRAVDSKLAPALRDALHSFAKPWYRLRALRVFRDDASLTANPALWPSIQAALAESEFFILLASPEAARSQWVEREIAFWIEHKSLDNFLVVLTDGEVVWDRAAPDFDWVRTTALPPVLRRAFADEPRYIDLRWARTEEHLSLNDGRFRDRVADLAAPLHHRAKDELAGEDVRQHRRTVRLTRGAIATLTVLALAASSAAVLAVEQRNTAVRQQKIALSRQLAAQAQTQQSVRPAMSLMLSLEALRAADTPEAHASLLDTLVKSPFAKILDGREKPIKEVEFSADGRLVAVAGDDDTVHVWQVGGATERQDVATLSGFGGDMRTVSFGDGRLMATSSGLSPNPLQLWDMSTPARPARLGQLSSGPAGGGKVQLAPGRRALVSHGDIASLWDVSQPRRPRLLGELPAGTRDTALSPNGRLVATAARPGPTQLWDVGDAKHPRLVASIPVLSDIVVFSPDSSMLAVTPRDSVANLWDVSNPRNPRFVTELRTASNTAAFDVDFAPDGKRAVTANFDGTASVWDISRPSSPIETTVLRGHTGAAYAADFSPDGRRIVTGSQDGTAIIWNVAPAATVQPLAQFGGFEGAPEVTVFSPDSRRLLVASDREPAAVWNVSRRDKPVRESILTPTGLRDATTNTRGDRLLAAGDGTAWLWDVSNFGRPRELRSFPGDNARLSADGKTVATVLNGVVRLWRNSGKDWQSVSSVPGDWVTFSPDPDLFAVTRDGKTTLARVSDPQHPVNAGMLTGFTPAFSGKRSLLALVDGEAIALWDVRDPSSPRKVATLPHQSGQATFNPDGTIMAIGNADGVPELWDVSDSSHPARIARLVGHRGSAYRVAFSPDGRVLATGSYDKSVRLWNLSATVDVLTDPVARACAIAGPGLSQADWNLYFPGETYRTSCPD